MKNKIFLLSLFFLTHIIDWLPAQSILDNWKYHQILWLDNSQSQENLVDYEVSFEINFSQLIESGKLHPQAQDLRLIDQNEQNFLCYSIENELFTPKTKIWVKIPYLKAGEKRKIYLCYGNPKAEKLDNQACTFTLFEDFNAPQIDENKWQIQGNGNIELKDGIAYFTANQQDIVLASREEFEMPTIMEMKVTACEGKYLSMAFIKSDKLPSFWEGYALGFNQLSAKMELALTQNETSPCGAFSFAPTGVKAKLSENHLGIWSLTWLFRNTIMASWNQQSLLEANAIWEIGKLNLALGVLACQTNTNQTGKLAVDWVRVRKLSANPPNVIFGSEQNNPKIGFLNYFKEVAG